MIHSILSQRTCVRRRHLIRWGRIWRTMVYLNWKRWNTGSRCRWKLSPLRIHRLPIRKWRHSIRRKTRLRKLRERWSWVSHGIGLLRISLILYPCRAIRRRRRGDRIRGCSVRFRFIILDRRWRRSCRRLRNIILHRNIVRSIRMCCRTRGIKRSVSRLRVPT